MYIYLYIYFYIDNPDTHFLTIAHPDSQFCFSSFLELDTNVFYYYLLSFIFFQASYNPQVYIAHALLQRKTPVTVTFMTSWSRHCYVCCSSECRHSDGLLPISAGRRRRPETQRRARQDRTVTHHRAPLPSRTVRPARGSAWRGGGQLRRGAARLGWRSAHRDAQPGRYGFTLSMLLGSARDTLHDCPKVVKRFGEFVYCLVLNQFLKSELINCGKINNFFFC